MKEPDAVDIKILQELLKDGRKSFRAIAQKCQLNENVIRSRFEELRKAGIIVGATVQYNFKRFGYSGVSLTMINVDSQYLAETYDRLRSIPDIRNVRILYNSPFNIQVIFTLKGLSDLEQVKQEVCKKNRINNIRTYIWTDVRNIPENTLGITTTILESNQLVITGDQTDVSTDFNETDVKIIDLLAKDGRLAFSKIAREVGSSTATVARKYEELRSKNLIKISIQIDFVKLGYQGIFSANLLLCDPNEANDVADKLSVIPGVSYILKMSGAHDLSFVGLVKDCKSIYEINDQIMKIPNIKGIETNLRPMPNAWPTPLQYITTF